MKFYKNLGKFDKKTLVNLKSIATKIQHSDSPAVWQYFPEIENYLLYLLGEQKLKIAKDDNNLSSIKLFISEKNHGMGLHKDGLKNKTAMNICISSNQNDWIRWFDDDIEACYEKEISSRFGGKILASRNLLCDDWRTLDKHIFQCCPEPGDLYLVNTDVYHSFYCAGPEKRIVVQIKFQGWPDIETVEEQLLLDNIIGLQ